MALNAKKIPHSGKSKFPPVEPLEAGTYPARLVQVIDLGLQEQRPFKGEPKDPAYMIYTTYELSDEFMKDEEGNDIEDKPRWLSEDFPLYSLEADLAKSTKRYLALDAAQEAAGDWAKLVNTPAMITVIQKPSRKDPDKVHNNITAVSSMRPKEAAKAPPLVNPPKVFNLDEPDYEIFKSLPEWLQDRIKENLDYEGSALQKLVEGQGEGSSKRGKEGSQKEEKAAQEAAHEAQDDGEDW